MKSLFTFLFTTLISASLSAQWLGGEQPAGHDLVNPEVFYKLHPALQTPSLYQPDSVSFYEYNEVNKKWEAHQSARFTYDSKGRLVELTYFQDMGKWVPYRRTEIRYNRSNQITRLSFFVESSQDEIEMERYEYQYFQRAEISSRRHFKRNKQLDFEMVTADSLAFDMRDSLPKAVCHWRWANGRWQMHQEISKITYHPESGLPKQFTYSAFDSSQNRLAGWQEFNVQHWRLGFRNWSYWLQIPTADALLFQEQGTESPYHYRPTDFSVRTPTNDGQSIQSHRMHSELRNGQITKLKRFVWANQTWQADQEIRLSWHASHLIDSILVMPLRKEATPRQLLRFDYDDQLHPVRFESREEKLHGRISRRHFAFNNQYDASGRPNIFETSYVDSLGVAHAVTRQEYHYHLRPFLQAPMAFTLQLGSSYIQELLRVKTNQMGQYECIQIIDTHGRLAWHWEPKLTARKELELQLGQLAPGPYGIFVTIDGQQAYTNFVKR